MAKGAGVVFVGTMAARVLGYLIRAVIARGYGQEMYGYISTSLAIFTVITTLALFGVSNSLPRQISLHVAREQWQRVSSSIAVAFLLILGIGTLLSAMLFFATPEIALSVYDNPSLTSFFYAFALGIPFYLILRLAAAVFRGFQRMTTFVFFRHVLRQGLIFLLVLVFYFLHLPEQHLGLVYFVAFLLCGLSALVFTLKTVPLSRRSVQLDLSEARTLFQFSWPLMMSSVVMMLLHYTDTLMIGYYLKQAQVGLYNAGVPISELLAVVYDSFVPLLVPIMTTYYARQAQSSLRDTYLISCKWIYLVTFPLYLLVLIHPQFFISLLFGSDYLAADHVVRVLATGIFFASMVGPTGNLLIVIGKPRLMFFDTAVAYVVNVVLNILLIPRFGLIGAAAATASSLILYNVLTLCQVYVYQRLAPPGKIYLLITLAGGVPGMLLWKLGEAHSGLGVAGLCLLFLAIYAGANILLRTLNEDDRMILNEVKKRLS